MKLSKTFFAIPLSLCLYSLRLRGQNEYTFYFKGSIFLFSIISKYARVSTAYMWYYYNIKKIRSRCKLKKNTHAFIIIKPY